LRAVVLSIGSELVSGLRLDTHSAAIAKALSGLGVEVLRHVTLDDDAAAIARAFREAAADADLVVATGGLGPTLDDCTRDALAAAMGEPLAEHPEAVAHLDAWAKARGRPISVSNRVQTLLPRGAGVLPNPVGTAVGIEALIGRARILCLPGVPAEMARMLDAEVLPRLHQAAPGRVTQVRTLRTFGMRESELGEALADLMAPGRRPHVGTAVHSGMIDVHIYATGTPPEVAALLEADARTVLQRLGAAVFAEGDAAIEHVVVRLLRERGLHVALAESCTGGLAAARLVNVPGASAVLLESIVAYANEAKVRDLGVDAGMLAREGAVSEAVARAMAEGARARTGADIAVAITGVAGPDGGTPDKPVGTVIFGLADAAGTLAERELLLGDRLLVRERAATYALNLLRLRLTGQAAGG
jgi:nicotinamide-nucleotide amidase